MSYKAIFDEAIAKIKNQETELYSGGIYTTDQVIRIVTHIYDRLVVGGVTTALTDNGIGVTKPILTKEMYDNLIERIEETVGNSIENLDGDGLIDKDSIELSISGREVSIENFDIDLDQVSSEATWGISSEVHDWAEEYGITITKK